MNVIPEASALGNLTSICHVKLTLFTNLVLSHLLKRGNSNASKIKLLREHHRWKKSGSNGQIAIWPPTHSNGHIFHFFLSMMIFRPTFHLSPGHLATWSAKTIGKRGIPEKSIQNVAQLRWNYLRRTLQSKVMAENRVLGNRPLYFTLQKSGTQFQRKESYLSKTFFVTFFVLIFGTQKVSANSKIWFLWTALMYNLSGTKVIVFD